MAATERIPVLLTREQKARHKIAGMSAQMQAQRQKIEDLTGRVIRLETALEIALASQGRRIEKR